MALIVEFTCELPNGVHARPASHVETLCNTFSSQIEWHNLRTDRKGNAKSALALIGTDTLMGDSCQLLISGADEQTAHQRLSQWLRDEFPHCDAPLAEVKSDELEPLPISLTNLKPRIIRARSVCSGSAGGILTPISSLDLNALGNLPAAKGVDAEQSALENGLTLVLKNIEFRLLDSDGATSAILEAHRSLASDTSLRQHLLAGVSAGLSCAEAIIASANHFCDEFARSSSSYLQERALDVHLNIPAEANPFLGYRAVRIYEEYASLFTTQLRSILRASAHGSLKIMIPMISSMEEILWVKEKLAEAKQQLRNEHIPFDEKIPLGIMLEVPSVMFIIDQCCEEIDFFSIGSNDLTQYLLAVDRDNAKVTRHYNSLNPAFLRALDYAVQAVHRQGKWIGLCGELGAKGSVLPLLIGLGLDELSMSAPSIPAAKARMAQLDSRECRQLLNQAMACRTSLEVEHLLAQFRMTQQDAPLVTAECITLESDWRNKEEVLKGMTDNLLLAGRCRYPRKLEADLWAREAVFSTGLGFSFAIPHSKSEHIEQSTISVTRLQAPVRWGDDEAQFIIMLTLNKHAAGDQHMRIFSRLARRIMHEEFRNALVNAASADAIASLLQHELEL
ncbi:putative PEP-binding protein [Escherichia albertii]|uniref:putative PEP-binding protein n=1 Tax=Escherichia albertii TaxID=208962 RepID=UPI00235E8B31|nr:putative PEP-binding protein [Escherichia albertii]WDB34096.1 PTS sugar transporter subunit IIA [Escherichia albertii]